MGNCMERWRQREGEEEKIDVRERAQGSFKPDGADDGNGGMKVKIVLTRHELDLFLLQMNRSHGENLMMSKDVMLELEKRIRRTSPSLLSSSPSSMAWEPSLESIVECPEVQEMDR
ncbi:unnamed protein product [Microthlaspi erraticum]|uniref:Uncharacterized protein n=1 Tax=Microthlaspi erraticum TaxID=1685480 RepID=A0A6D2JPX7_9BRAS|nr:unnamed protein product [Microthlaspi erraticum]